MGMAALEKEILTELKHVTGNSKLKKKDMLEWRSGKGIKPVDGETLYWLPELQVEVALASVNKKEDAAE
jgi:hypothetical protein